MYVERKPSLYIEELRSEFKDNLHHFKDGDEAFDRLIGFVELDHLYLSLKRNQYKIRYSR